MKDGRPEHREIYQGLIERIQRKSKLADLELRTLFSHLIKLPETYKIDFIKVHLLNVLTKSEATVRDEQIFQHYRNYVSIPCLAALLSVLRESKCDFGKPVLQLLEHIRHLQLMPGPSQKERESLEHLQYDLIYLLQNLQKRQQEVYQVDISNPEKQHRMAESFYNRIISSFISESENDLVEESTFINNLKLQELKSEKVKTFAAKINQLTNTHDKSLLVELGTIIAHSIQQTYHENYKGVFNGDREYVIAHFEEAIKNRAMDADDSTSVPLEPISSSILAIVLELIFNDGFGAFRQTLTQSVFKQLEK